MSGNEIYAHWRDSARIPRFFIVDARAALVVLAFFLRPSWYTFGAAIFFILLLSVLDYFKIPLMVAIRIARGALAGRRKIRMPRS